MLSSVACGSGSPAALQAAKAGGLDVPVELDLERIERGERCVDDLLADPVSRDQRRGDGLGRHGGR